MLCLGLDHLVAQVDALGVGLSELLLHRRALGLGLDQLVVQTDALRIGLGELLLQSRALGLGLDQLAVQADAFGLSSEERRATVFGRGGIS